MILTQDAHTEAMCRWPIQFIFVMLKRSSEARLSEAKPSRSESRLFARADYCYGIWILRSPISTLGGESLQIRAPRASTSWAL